MTAYDDEGIKNLLKQALPPAATDAEPARDLWPDVLHRLDAESSPTAALPRSSSRTLPWFDWALIAGLIAFAVAFPAAIPMFLYYL